MAASIDKTKCMGCGTCVALCPQIFAMDVEGTAKVKESVDLTCCDVLEVVNSCPAGAIFISE